jgi:hypothetical protein
MVSVAQFTTVGLRSHGAAMEAAVAGVALFVSAALPAAAAPINPASLVPALDAYVDALAAGHVAALACATAWPPMKVNEAGWTKAKATFIATLWANDFPIDFVRTVTQRLDAPPPATKPDCAHPGLAIAAELGLPSAVGWVEAVQNAFNGLDLMVIADPIAPDTWTAIKGMIAKALPDEKRLLDCVAVRYPWELPALVHDWDAMLGKIAGSLGGTGLPRDEIGATLSSAEANQLWHRAAPDVEAELRNSCAKDQSVEASLANFSFRGLDAAIDKLLPAAPSSDSGSN